MSKAERPRFLSLAGVRVLSVPVNTRQYGHMALELVMGLAEAAQRGSAVMWRMQGHRVAPGLATLRCPRVPEIASPARRAVVGCLFGLDRVRTRAVEWCREAKIELQLQARNEYRRPQYPRPVAMWLKDLSQQPGEMPWRHREGAGPYMRRQLLRQIVPVVQREPEATEARARARALGIADDQAIVALHVREAGFKLGREMHNAKANARDDSSRNARIESFQLAIDWLVSRGFTVVRVGDNSMTPFDHPGVVDLTQIAPYDSLLEVHCLLRSRFLIAGEAGPSGASYLTNTPLLTVNATDPISSFPIRRHGLFVLKRVRDRQTGRVLGVNDLLTEDYASNLRNTTRYQYQDNSPEELLEAVQEMIDDLDHDRPESVEQAAFRQAVTDACSALGPFHAYVRKWGPENGFLGDGRLAQFTFASWPTDGAGAERPIERA